LGGTQTWGEKKKKSLRKGMIRQEGGGSQYQKSDGRLSVVGTRTLGGGGGGSASSANGGRDL